MRREFDSGEHALWHNLATRLLEKGELADDLQTAGAGARWFTHSGEMNFAVRLFGGC